MVILYDRIAIERCIHVRDFHRGLHCGFQNKIVYRDLRDVSAIPARFQFLARLHERPSIDVDVEIEMRNWTKAFDKTLCDDLAHAGELNTRAFARSHCQRRLYGGSWFLRRT